MVAFLTESNVSIDSIEVSDGNHAGYVDLRIKSALMLIDDTKEQLNQLPVEGIDEIIIRASEPVLRLAAASGPNGPMSYEELKRLATAFKRALVTWASKLSPQELDSFTRIAQASTNAFAVHSEPRG